MLSDDNDKEDSIFNLGGLNTIHSKVAYFGHRWEAGKVCFIFLA